MAANGGSMPLAAGVGLISTPSILLSNVYYIPSFTMNLASVGQICDSRNDVLFPFSDCLIQDWQTREVIRTGCRERGLYVFGNFKDLSVVAASTVDFSFSSWALRQLESHDIFDCSGCKLAYFSALPFNKSVSFSNAPFDLVHSDVWGPYPVLTKGDGTIHQTSCTDTPQQNGVVERKHHHLVETTRSFLLSTQLPRVYWGKRLYGQVPDYFSLRVFCCTCFVLKPHVECTKLTTKSTLCVFLGYGSGQKGYHCYDPVGQKLYTSRHVQFLEHAPYFSVPASSHHLTQPGLIKLDPFDNAAKTSQQTPQETPQEIPQETPTNTAIEIPIETHVRIVTQPPPIATQSYIKVVMVLL
ncbi:gag-pol polyprotein [Tanacetum coccineum]